MKILVAYESRHVEHRTASSGALLSRRTNPLLAETYKVSYLCVCNGLMPGLISWDEIYDKNKPCVIHNFVSIHLHQLIRNWKF